MEYPRFVFISPGKSKCQGGSYDGELVIDQSEFDSAIKAGFSETLPESLKVADEIKNTAIDTEAKNETPKESRGPGRPKKTEV